MIYIYIYIYIFLYILMFFSYSFKITFFTFQNEHKILIKLIKFILFNYFLINLILANHLNVIY
jgi:hypothetical protein